MTALLAILDGASEWLGSQGTDQWAGSRWRAEELRPDLATGGLRVAEKLPGPPNGKSETAPGSRQPPESPAAAGATVGRVGSPPPQDVAAAAGPAFAEAGRNPCQPSRSPP